MTIELIRFSECKSAALAGSAHIHTAPGDGANTIQIIEASGFNDSAATIYWQLFLYNAGAGPAVGAVPLMSILVPSKQNFYWRPYGGFYIADSAQWVASTAAATYQAGAGNAVWCYIKYLPNLYLVDVSNEA